MAAEDVRPSNADVETGGEGARSKEKRTRGVEAETGAGCLLI